MRRPMLYFYARFSCWTVVSVRTNTSVSPWTTNQSASMCRVCVQFHIVNFNNYLFCSMNGQNHGDIVVGLWRLCSAWKSSNGSEIVTGTHANLTQCSFQAHPEGGQHGSDPGSRYRNPAVLPPCCRHSLRDHPHGEAATQTTIQHWRWL